MWAVAGGSRDVAFAEFHGRYLRVALGSGSDDSCEHETALRRGHQEDRSGLSLSVCLSVRQGPARGYAQLTSTGLLPPLSSRAFSSGPVGFPLGFSFNVLSSAVCHVLPVSSQLCLSSLRLPSSPLLLEVLHEPPWCPAGPFLTHWMRSDRCVQS